MNVMNKYGCYLLVVIFLFVTVIDFFEFRSNLFVQVIGIWVVLALISNDSLLCYA